MKAKIKTKKVKMLSKDNMNDLHAMFNQMLGTDNINLVFAYPRYRRMGELAAIIIHDIGELTQSRVIIADYKLEHKEMSNFVCAARDSVAAMFDTILNIDTISDEDHKRFSILYNENIRSNIFEYFAIMAKQLNPYSKYLAAGDSSFIHRIPGIEWTPLPFTTLNMKELLMVAVDARPAVLASLVKIHKNCHEIIREAKTPNIDLDKFSQIILDSLEQIQKQPKLARCSAAFNKIKESIDLLKTNFGQYYEDYMCTMDETGGNSTIIMENFIIDVSKSTKASPTLMREFREIINFYKESFQKRDVTNAHTNKIFEHFDKLFEHSIKEDMMPIEIDTVTEEQPTITVETEEHKARVRASKMSVEELAAEIEGVSVKKKNNKH